MTLHVTHAFVSGKGDGPDSTLVRPSAVSGGWNADHNLVTDSVTPVVLGRQSAGAGPIEELPLSTLFPTGIVIDFAGTTPPTGWLLCYGQSVTQAAYPALYAVIGQIYGAGPGPATFVIPDLRGTTIAGKSNMGGADRGNLPSGATLGQYLGVSANGPLGVSVGLWWSGGGYSAGGYTQGAQSVNITTGGESHGTGGVAFGGGGYFADGHTHNVNGGTGGEALGVVINSFGASGGTSSFSIVQPTVVMNKIIKT